MNQAIFLGARVDKEIIRMVEETAEEERVDKTKALKELIFLGRKQYLLRKYLAQYRENKCSLDKAAEKIGITVAEMMQEAVKAKMQSEETFEEYRTGLSHLHKIKTRSS
ncbi:MAG TPA: hypothetical protein VJI15_00260 [Candidatus Nanoarchaeia archaeon]|nr:hypothetical protein [Candidatus Nanoarchaeia archaeon]